MLNLLLFLFAVTCLAIAAAWLAENPGDVTIYWFDYRIDTSFSFLLLSTVVSILATIILYHLCYRILAAPNRFLQSRYTRQYQRGLTELTYSVAALAASDIKGAETHTRKAEKLLGQTPLTLMLAAQVARSQGDDEKTRRLFEQMLEHKETEYLAARSLSDTASKEETLPKALELAQRAYKVGPKDTVSLSAIISLDVKLGKWQEALHAISQAKRKSQIIPSTLKRYRGLVHAGQAQQLHDARQSPQAMLHIRQAQKFLPDFVPTVLLEAKMLAEGDRAKAVKLLQGAWKRAHHPQLYSLLKELIKSDPTAQQEKILRKFDGAASLPNGRWNCQSCNHNQLQWDLHCPQCNTFDSMEWR